MRRAAYLTSYRSLFLANIGFGNKMANVRFLSESVRYDVIVVLSDRTNSEIQVVISAKMGQGKESNGVQNLPIRVAYAESSCSFKSLAEESFQSSALLLSLVSAHGSNS